MVTEVGHDYCFLKWNPPLATGVSDERERITGYVIEKKGTNRRVWQVEKNFFNFTRNFKKFLRRNFKRIQKISQKNNF